MKSRRRTRRTRYVFGQFEPEPASLILHMRSRFSNYPLSQVVHTLLKFSALYCGLGLANFMQTFRLLHEEGFYVGASSGLNVCAAVQVARDLGPGHTVVTCLCDTGQRYFTRLFSRSWLEGKGLLDVLPRHHRKSLIE